MADQRALGKPATCGKRFAAIRRLRPGAYRTMMRATTACHSRESLKRAFYCWRAAGMTARARMRRLPEVSMQVQFRILIVGLLLLPWGATGSSAQQIGKYVPIPAGSDADHAMTELNAASDPAQKLALIDKFAGGAQGDMALVADEMYVNYYIAAKQYDKAFEYGDKLFALDPGNFNNAVNMVRAASEKGDQEKLLGYGEKAQSIMTAYRASPPPEGTAADAWSSRRRTPLKTTRTTTILCSRRCTAGCTRRRTPPSARINWCALPNFFRIRRMLCRPWESRQALTSRHRTPPK